MSAVCDTIGVPICGAMGAVRMLLASNTRDRGWVVTIVAHAKTEASRIDVAMTPEEQGAEDGLSQEIEDAVEDGLRVWSDDIASFADSPCDWIEFEASC